MKFDYLCPKCNSAKVVKVEGWAMNQTTIASTSKWGLQKAVIDRYFCINCGYTEEYAQLSKNFLKWGNAKLKEDDRGDGFV